MAKFPKKATREHDFVVGGRRMLKWDYGTEGTYRTGSCISAVGPSVS
jgi:hypothetical protein